MTDRIADIWGSRTPHARGTVWPVRVDQYLDEGVTEADVDRWVQSACLLCSNGCGADIAVKDGRMVGVRGRAGDPVNHGRLGPKDLYGGRPWAPPRTGSPARWCARAAAWSRPTGTPRWAASSQRVTAAARGEGPLSHGFYTSRPAVPRGVLHARRDRQGRPRHAPHGRQHPAVHGDRRGGVQGVVRHRRPARLLHRHRALRRDLPLRPQHGRDPDRAVDADARPHPGRGPAADRVRRPAAHAGRRGGRAHRRGAPRAAGRHQPGADERR